MGDSTKLRSRELARIARADLVREQSDVLAFVNKNRGGCNALRDDLADFVDAVAVCASASLAPSVAPFSRPEAAQRSRDFCRRRQARQPARVQAQHARCAQALSRQAHSSGTYRSGGKGYTFYEAAVLAKAAAPAEAMEFIRLLASARSGDKWRAAARLSPSPPISRRKPIKIISLIWRTPLRPSKATVESTRHDIVARCPG